MVWNMANYQLPTPEAMVYTGHVVINWQIFEKAFLDYSTAVQLTKRDVKVQAATLKTIMGKDCRQILPHLEFTDAKKKDLSAILDKQYSTSWYFAPTRNISYESYLFHTVEQQPNKMVVDQYIVHLCQLAGAFKFENLHNKVLQDHLELGCQDKGG